MADLHLSDLLNRKIHCECGEEHYCPIQDIIVETGALEKLPGLLEKYGWKDILLVSDDNTEEACGKRVKEILRAAGIPYDEKIFHTGKEMLVPDELTGFYLLEAADPKKDALIAIGSGVLNDLCKYVSYKMGKPYLVVATAPSMDGYASSHSPFIARHMKETYPSQMPTAIVGDVEVLKNAPMDMILSGYGDIMGKCSSLCDWKLSNIVMDVPYCEFIAGLMERAYAQCAADTDKIAARDEGAICRLMESLILAGVAMSLIGHSRPASGAEHHLSHFFEVEGIMKNQPYLLHGMDVAYSTAVSCEIRDKIKEIDPAKTESRFDKETWEANVEKVFGPAAQGVRELQEQLGYYLPETIQKHRERICERWQEILATLAKVPSGPEYLSYLTRAGLPMSRFFSTYDRQTIRDAIVYSKDLKNYYSTWRLLDELGLLERFADGYMAAHA